MRLKRPDAVKDVRPARESAEIVIVGPLPFLEKPETGLARYVHLLADSLAHTGRRVVVGAQRGAWRNPAAAYRQAHVWSPGIASFGAIYRFLLQERARSVNVQHEPDTYGSLPVNAMFIVFLGLCRLSGIRVTVTLCNARPTAEIRAALMDDRTHWKRERFLILILGHRFFNFATGLLSFRIVVLHPEGAGALPRFCRSRVSVIPLIVPRLHVEATEIERVRNAYALPKDFILSFGFLAKRKGLEHYIEAARGRSNGPFVIVAALDRTTQHDPEYRRYYDLVRRQAEAAGIRWIGFVPETDIEPVLKNCRLLILPYVTRPDESAIVSIAASLDVPALVSRIMRIPEFSEVAIEPSKMGITSAIERYLADPLYAAAVAAAGRTYQRSHSPSVVTAAYSAILHG